MNRFYNKNENDDGPQVNDVGNDDNNNQTIRTETEIPTSIVAKNIRIEEEHQFDTNVEASRLFSIHTTENDDNSNQSVVIRYNKYQSFFSLWKTMIDEVRVLKYFDDSTLSNGDENAIEVMIGFGCMAWSGGVLNSSPFCLYRTKKKQTDK